MTGPKPRIRLARKPRLWFIGSASITTFCVLERLGELLGVGEDGDLGRERLVGLRVAVLELLLEPAVDGGALGGDALDVARADLLEERREVRDADRLGLARSEHGDEQVVGGEQRRDDQQDPHPRRPERRLLLVAVLARERGPRLAFGGLRCLRHRRCVAGRGSVLLSRSDRGASRDAGARAARGRATGRSRPAPAGWRRRRHAGTPRPACRPSRRRNAARRR